MRFARMNGRLISWSRVQVKIGGRGKVERVKLFTTDEPIARIPPDEFTDMVQDGTIQRLDLPHTLKSWAERTSKRIGPIYTPQFALGLLEQKLQDHATSLSSDLNTSPASVGEVVS